jgi:hypothetical protein
MTIKINQNVPKEGRRKEEKFLDLVAITTHYSTISLINSSQQKEETEMNILKHSPDTQTHNLKQ